MSIISLRADESSINGFSAVGVGRAVNDSASVGKNREPQFPRLMQLATNQVSGSLNQTGRSELSRHLRQVEQLRRA